MIQGIDIAAMRGLSWLKKQKPATMKDISRSIQALSLWNEPATQLIELLLSGKKDGFWETEAPLLDTARACSALAGCGAIQSDSLQWILNQQKNDNWSDSEIDTAYALIALGESGVKNEAGCEWLVRNYGEKWEHAGTTSLIITALLKQDGNEYRFFINDRAGWLLSKRLFGGWMHIATSNLVIQALILAGERDIEKEIGPSIKWLLEKQNKDNWGNITASALSLISLGMYLDKLNSNSDK
ncbi:Uncharacterised protein [uncultured archaeon]|nr:Uncharacterised protein [uncultured archaeon]